MLHLDSNFSSTQRLVTPAYTQNGSLEDRICAVFSSVFLLLDTSIHLLTAAYKGFVWTVFQISCKNPPDYYKEAYSHFIKALLCASMIPFGSLSGFIFPSVFQSKELQEYLRWQIPINISETIENKMLKEELQSKNKEIKGLKLEIDSLKEITALTVSENNPQSPEESLGSVKIANLSFSSRESMISLDSEDEYVDAIEHTNGINETLEKELLSKNEEIKRLKSQKSLLDKILSRLETLHSYNQILVIQKALNKSMTDTPIIYEYLPISVKKEINEAFQCKLHTNFLQFCTQTNPDIKATDDVFTDLLNKHTFISLLHPKETSISTLINTLFSFV